MQKNAKSSLKDVIVVGFAMFAIFFGAGNLIFPPYLGMVSGQEWFKGFLCFMIADAGLAVMTVLAMIRYDGTVWSMLRRLSKPAAAVMATVAMLCVGPLLCIPRTCATTFEMGVLPLFPECSPWLFGALFFGAVFILTVRPSAVIDIIGKFLTPALLLTLAVLFVKGVIHPIGTISTAAPAVNVAQEGLLAGYQTMDVLATLLFGFIILKSAQAKGYTKAKAQIRVVSGASLVAGIGLLVVYLGLTYLGATTANLFDITVDRTYLVTSIVQQLLGHGGLILFAIVVALACITTAVGLVSACANYFSGLSGGRLSYPVLVCLICLFSAVVSNFGINEIIAIASPILSVVYPPTLALIVLALFGRRIRNDWVFRLAALGALVISLLEVISSYTGLEIAFLSHLPLASLGFAWVVPALLCGVIGHFIPHGKKKSLAS